MLLLMLLAAGLAHADPLGRLFFSPAERASLDKARQTSIVTRAAPPSEEPQQEQVPLDAKYTLNGVIRRSDGISVLWVNGRPQVEKSAAAARSTAAQASVAVGADNRSARMKVGQTLNSTTGTVTEVYDSPKRAQEPRPATASAAPASTAAAPSSAPKTSSAAPAQEIDVPDQSPPPAPPAPEVYTPLRGAAPPPLTNTAPTAPAPSMRGY